jgi:predicted dehydrogenase
MINVALVGLGNIGLLFDTDTKNLSKCLSHTKAIYTNKNFDLKYVVDIDRKKFEIVQTFFPNCHCFCNYEEIVNQNDIHLLVIATPTKTHYTILNAFSKNETIRYFFIEKPLFELDANYSSIASNVQKKIIINYSRRFSNAISNMKEFLITKQINPQKIIIHYCKGLKNNGSHMIDLINYLFQNPTIQKCHIVSTSNGLDENDKNYDLYLELDYKNTPIPTYFIAHDHTKYNFIEVEIFSENYLIKLNNGKSEIQYYEKINHPEFPTYKIFSDPYKTETIDGDFLLGNAYTKIFDMFTNKVENISSFDDELQNQKFYNTVIKEVNK